jgi:hypothetical protein
MEWRLVLATLFLGIFLYCVLFLAYQVIPSERTIVESEQEPVGDVKGADGNTLADVGAAMFPMDIGSNKYMDTSGNLVYPW